jgi:hypothetical protein
MHTTPGESVMTSRLRVSAAAALLVVASLLGGVPSGAFDPNDPSLDPEKGTLEGSPVATLPPYIKRVSATGMRPDWSPDGRSLIYTDAPLGNVWRLELRTGRRTNLTGRFATFGFLRAHQLHSGDILLCGPEKAPSNAGTPEAGRFEGRLFVLQKPFTRRPVPLGRPCWEGQAVSRRTDHIAWNESSIDFTDPDQEFLVGRSEIWTGDIVRDRAGRPRLTHVTRALTRGDLPTKVAPIEVQDFRGRDERELLLTAYGVLTGEVFGFDLRTRAAVDYSGYSPFYEEAEGTARSGAFDVVERDLMVNPIPGALDLWLLPLDGSAAFRRLTHFNRHKGYGASNPVVSPDDRLVAFQLSVSEGAEGEGQGLFVLDLSKALAAGS